MCLPSPVAAKIKEAFALYAAGELKVDSALYEVIHVTNCYYAGNSDLAKLMLLRDIERNYEKSGRYETGFSYRRYECCRRAEEKAGLCRMIARLVAGFARSDYVTLTFS